MCVTHNELFFHVFTPHLSTCEWRCPWPSPAVWLGQSHQSLQPACCTGTDISTRHAAESLGDQICKGEQQVCWGQVRFSVSTAHSRRRLDLCFRCPSSYLILKGVAGSTLGFCFWGASSSFLFLFHPNHPLRGKWQVTIEKNRKRKKKKWVRNSKEETSNTDLPSPDAFQHTDPWLWLGNNFSTGWGICLCRLCTYALCFDTSLQKLSICRIILLEPKDSGPFLT